MGWSGGSILFNEVIDTIRRETESIVKETLGHEMRKRIYNSLIVAFQEIGDCDTLDECRGRDKAFDEAWFEIYGEDE